MNQFEWQYIQQIALKNINNFPSKGGFLQVSKQPISMYSVTCHFVLVLLFKERTRFQFNIQENS